MFINILVIGKENSGKSSLIQRFTHNTFSSTRKKTFGLDPSGKKIDVDGQSVTLMLHDLPGNQNIASLTPKYLRDISIFVFVVDLTDPESLQFTQQCKANMETVAINKDSLTILVGTKSDIDIPSVKIDQLETLATKLGLQFNRATNVTSAKTNININELFTQPYIVATLKKLLNPVNEVVTLDQKFRDHQDLLIHYLSKQINRWEGNNSAKEKRKFFKAFRQAAIECKELPKLIHLIARVKHEAFQHRDVNCFTYFFKCNWWRYTQSYNELTELFDQKNKAKLTTQEISRYQTADYLDDQQITKQRLLNI